MGNQGQNATFHRGGYARFYQDITQYVKIGQTNEIVVFVYDPTDYGNNTFPSALAPPHFRLTN